MRTAPRDKWYILVLGYIIMLLVIFFAAGLIFAIYCCCNAALRLFTQPATAPQATTLHASTQHASLPYPSFPAVKHPVAHQACDLFAQWGQATGLEPSDAGLYDILGIQWPCGSAGNDYAALRDQVRDAYQDTAQSFTPNVLVTNAGSLQPDRYVGDF